MRDEFYQNEAKLRVCGQSKARGCFFRCCCCSLLACLFVFSTYYPEACCILNGLANVLFFFLLTPLRTVADVNKQTKQNKKEAMKFFAALGMDKQRDQVYSRIKANCRFFCEKTRSLWFCDLFFLFFYLVLMKAIPRAFLVMCSLASRYLFFFVCVCLFYLPSFRRSSVAYT